MSYNEEEFDSLYIDVESTDSSSDSGDDEVNPSHVTEHADEDSQASQASSSTLQENNASKSKENESHKGHIHKGDKKSRSKGTNASISDKSSIYKQTKSKMTGHTSSRTVSTTDSVFKAPKSMVLRSGMVAEEKKDKSRAGLSELSIIQGEMMRQHISLPGHSLCTSTPKVDTSAWHLKQIEHSIMDDAMLSQSESISKSRKSQDRSINTISAMLIRASEDSRPSKGRASTGKGRGRGRNPSKVADGSKSTTNSQSRSQSQVVEVNADNTS